MKPLSTIMISTGLVVLLGVFAVAGLFSLSGTTEGTVGALFVALVFGIPAVGFFVLMLSLGSVISGASRVLDPSHSRNTDTASGDAASPATPPDKRRTPLSWGATACFVAAVLWSVPNGFLAFVTVVTGDTKAGGYLLYWLIPAGALFAMGMGLTSLGKRIAELR